MPPATQNSGVSGVSHTIRTPKTIATETLASKPKAIMHGFEARITITFS